MTPNEPIPTPVNKDWVELKLQASLKDYVTREVHDRDVEKLSDDVKQIRVSLWGPSTDGKVPELQELRTAIGSKLEKPSIWGIVLPIIVALVTWAASKAFGAPLG
jgi:hypothetical protein|nr:MAG TPA: hypothetical protein [Caudoviricetes sp.]